MIWTEEKDLKLKELRGLDIPFGECAIILGTTRSAIAGRCKRLGLSESKPRLQYQAPPKPKRIAPFKPGPTKRDLREELAQAVRNTR